MYVKEEFGRGQKAGNSFRQRRVFLRTPAPNPFALSPGGTLIYVREMENKGHAEMSFGARLSAALSCFFRMLGDAAFARQMAALLRAAPSEKEPKAVEEPVEKRHASGLRMLSLLQREGRLIDFLQEDVAAFSDAEIGAAARVVHGGCKKALNEHLTMEPILKEAEGASVSVPAGFDAQRIRVTGNVAGQPPFRGTLKHHGWAVTAVRLPAVSDSIDPRVLAAAEVEL